MSEKQDRFSSNCDSREERVTLLEPVCSKADEDSQLEGTVMGPVHSIQELRT